MTTATATTATTKPTAVAAARWDPEEFGALFDRVLSIVGEGEDGVEGRGGGAFNLLPRLMLTYGGPTEAVEGVARDIERGCRLASAAVLCDRGEEDRARAKVALSALYYVNQAICASTVAFRTVSAASAGNYESAADSGEALAAGIARFSTPDPEDTNRVQQLLLYLLNTAQVRSYRRRHGEMYQRLRARGKHADCDTHAWERVCDMRDFVYEATRKEVNYDMWLNLTCMRTNVSAAIDHLLSCHDVQLPDLERDRRVFSFSNGIYLAAEDRFVAYGSADHAALPSELVAAKFFDLPFLAGDVEDWYADIATPHLQSILDYQDMSEAVSRWMYAMIGRLIYEVGELDGWQVVPFLKGAASSGKSTILTRVCRGLYEAADVGTLSNNIERKFGLSALADKLIFIGPEIKSDIALEQAEFQSIVSGESVQVAAKFKTAQTVEWKVPGALAGNEVPSWVDNAGSINRRIVLFEFPKRVHDGDMELGRKIDREMPAILRKCNKAYLEAVSKYAKDNLWKHLPAPFHASKEEFTESVNSIVHFLRSGQLQFAPNAYMPYEVFASTYEQYATAMGLQRIRLVGDKVSQPLADAGCRVAKNQSMRYPRSGGGTVQTGRFLIGCDLVSRPVHGFDTDPLDDPLGDL